jgi:hypothetical protein
MSDTDLLTKIASDVGEIKGKLDLLEIKLFEMDKCLDDLPVVKTQLTNHLSHHETTTRFFWYPVSVMLFVSLVLFLLKVIFHVL